MKRSSFLFILLTAAIFLAGISSLIYEVLWIRQLGFALGSTAVATSIMLTAFLGGLSVGSMIIGRFADHLENPIRVFILVEILASIAGLASIPALASVGRAYVLISSTIGLTGFWAMLARALFALLIMAIPALLFGMTFPLATVIGTRFVGGQLAAGVVSAASSFGSAIGALLCGLWLEPTFGLFTSAQVAAFLNLVAAFLIAITGVLIRSTRNHDSESVAWKMSV